MEQEKKMVKGKVEGVSINGGKDQDYYGLKINGKWYDPEDKEAQAKIIYDLKDKDVEIKMFDDKHFVDLTIIDHDVAVQEKIIPEEVKEYLSKEPTYNELETRRDFMKMAIHLHPEQMDEVKIIKNAKILRKACEENWEE